MLRAHRSGTVHGTTCTTQVHGTLVMEGSSVIGKGLACCSLRPLYSNHVYLIQLVEMHVCAAFTFNYI